jgi:protein-S-isoprenylcysteine O-methyltransferase Ste14
VSGLAFAWLLFVAAFAAGHLRVKSQRGGGAPPEQRVLRDNRSNYGLVLQGVALLVALFWGGFRREEWWLAVWVLAYGSVVLGAASLWALGRQWRVQAVVTADHELVTSGPYRVVRHPVYLALLGMLVATLLWRSPWEAALISVAIYVAGTEIRVRAEDGILSQAFGAKFESYRRSTAAYLPGLR